MNPLSQNFDILQTFQTVLEPNKKNKSRNNQNEYGKNILFQKYVHPKKKSGQLNVEIKRENSAVFLGLTQKDILFITIEFVLSQWIIKRIHKI